MAIDIPKPSQLCSTLNPKSCISSNTPLLMEESSNTQNESVTDEEAPEKTVTQESRLVHQQQKAQTLLDNIVLLEPKQMMDEHLIHETTKEAEVLAQECLETLQDSDLEPILCTTILFSDIWSSLGAAQSGPEMWVAPSSFERITSKYWVEEHNLAKLLLAASTKAPLLVYGVSGLLTHRLKDVPSVELWKHISVKVTSVYLDSPSMDLYHARIKREEGSRLLRARWYGPKPSGDAPIFLELKTHHEGWTTDRSVKQRVVIQEVHMPYFLSSVPWTEDFARQIVSIANPDQGESSREKAVSLLLQMKQMIIQMNLRPCVRSVYDRVSFQSPRNNDLRMTLDRGVTLIDEASGMAGSSSSWCVSDESTWTGHVFPYAILEIKIASSEVPHDFVQTWEDSGIIIDAAKFSKFQTGAAAYNKEKIEIMPYWASHSSFAKFMSLPEHTGGASDTPPTSFPMTTTTSFLRVSQSNVEEENSLPPTPSPRNRLIGPRRLLTLPMAATSTDSIIPPLSKTSSQQRPARVEPKTYFANERTYIQWMSGAFLLVTIATIIFDINNTASKGISIGLLAIASIISVYAIYVYYRRIRLLEARQPYGYNDRHGPVLLAVALLLGIAILLSYFSDSFRPTAKSLLLNRPLLRSESMFCTQHVLRGINLLQYQPSDVLPWMHHPGDLIIPSLSQITTVATARTSGGTALVHILAEVPDTDMEAVTQLRNGILTVSEGGDKKSRLLKFDWKDSSASTSPNNRRLELVSSVTISSPLVEGLALVGDDLYVAGNRLDESTGLTYGALDVYLNFTNYDFRNATTERLSGTRLNSKLLNQGLADSKIGSLYYFEGILYILYDNAQMVRGWSLERSEHVLEWLLPRAPTSTDDFDKQWEGMALERCHSENRLLLHLTLDSPPQVWTLQLVETPVPGDTTGTQKIPSLPGCAS